MSGALAPAQIDALREVGNIGAGTAATALSVLTGAPVAMSVPTVRLLPVESVGAALGFGDEPVAAVFLGVEGEAPGHILFLMREAAARHVIGMVMGHLGPKNGIASFGEMELSALQETGNILASSYLRALSELTGLRLEPTPPAVGVDLGEALVGAALGAVGEAADTVLLIESAFGDAGTPGLSDVLFIPTSEALARVLARLGVGA